VRARICAKSCARIAGTLRALRGSMLRSIVAVWSVALTLLIIAAVAG
jgi:hypothetical protein